MQTIEQNGKQKDVHVVDDRGNWIPLKWWEFEKWKENQTRLRDKFIRIKIRYSGEDLAIIYAIKTLYTVTYS